MVTYTDDPSDHCPYCCGWITDPSDESEQEQIPINVDGSIIERLYRPCHTQCLAMVAAYENDHRGDVS